MADEIEAGESQHVVSTGAHSVPPHVSPCLGSFALARAGEGGVVKRPVNCDYKIDPAIHNNLAAASLGSVGMRRELLRRIQRKHGTGALLEAFAQFMGLANSVVESNRRSITDLLVECGVHESPNMSTILGAFEGIRAAVSPARGMCGGCAFRLGTPANQSISTVASAEECLRDGSTFLCHINGIDKEGRATQPCAGAAKARRTLR